MLTEIQQKYQAYSDYLSKIQFKTRSGNLVPLSEVVSLKEDAMPQSINHTSVLPSVTISFNTKAGISLGEAVDHLQQVAARTLPDTMRVTFTGTAQVFQQSLQNLTLLLIVAIGVVYIVLGVLYESYIHHDSFGTAFRVFGRAADVDCLQSRSKYLFFCRISSADRISEKERDHADRFRAGSRAAREKESSGSDL